MQFKRFEPTTQTAALKVQELIQRGGNIIIERREYVEIKRMQSIARIDQHGRVEWRSE